MIYTCPCFICLFRRLPHACSLSSSGPNGFGPCLQRQQTRNENCTDHARAVGRRRRRIGNSPARTTALLLHQQRQQQQHRQRQQEQQHQNRDLALTSVRPSLSLDSLTLSRYAAAAAAADRLRCLLLPILADSFVLCRFFARALSHRLSTSNADERFLPQDQTEGRTQRRVTTALHTATS